MNKDKRGVPSCISFVLKKCTLVKETCTVQTLKSNCFLRICYSIFVFRLNLRPTSKYSKICHRHFEANDKFRLQTKESNLRE